MSDAHSDFTSFKFGLPHLKEALNSKRKVRIIAIGSSSTAGVPPVVPFPPRLEMLLRKKFFGQMIDVVNRGISGQEAPEELARFQTDVFDEAPVLVIWQVGTNAVFHNLNRDEAEAAIKFGLQWLKSLPADVVLMDLQYTKAMLDRLEASTDMVSRIAKVADNAKVDVFKRFALMKRWVDDKIPISSLQDASDLHTGDFATECITHALFGEIQRALDATT